MREALHFLTQITQIRHRFTQIFVCGLLNEICGNPREISVNQRQKNGPLHDRPIQQGQAAKKYSFQ